MTMNPPAANSKPSVAIPNAKTALTPPETPKRRGRPKMGRSARVVMSAMSVSESTKLQMERWARDYSWKVADCPPGVIQDLLVEFGRDRGFDFKLAMPRSEPLCPSRKSRLLSSRP